MRLLLAAVCCAALSACSTSYKVAPSNRKSDQLAAKVSENVSKAEVRAKANKERVKSAASKVVASEQRAAKVVDDINVAITKLDLHDYPAVGVALIQAKIDAGILLASYEALKEDLRVVEKDNDDLIIDLAIVKQTNEKILAANAEFQAKVDKLAQSQAKNQAIVDQVNWGFGLGAFIYGIKRILTFGFFGIIGLVIVVVVLLCVGGPVGAFVLNGLRSGVGLLRKRKG